MTALVLLLAAPGGVRDAVAGTRPVPAARVNPAAVTGFLYQPAYSIDRARRLPAEPYTPQPGDLLLLSDPTPVYRVLYALAGTGRPGHGGLVVRLPDGQLGLFEAGFNDTLWTRITPLEWRLNAYPGTVWVRRRCVPLTENESARLSGFAAGAADTRYSVAKFAGQLTPVRRRGPLRTWVVGKPSGPGHRYHCAEALLEALVYAGLVDGATARPVATYPRDLFFDDSPNPYQRRHPPLAGGWAVPALWTRGPGPVMAVPYSAFMRPGVYAPAAGLISDEPAKENRR